MSKYKVDASGKNFRIGSPEHARHEKIEKVLFITTAAVQLLAVAAIMVGLSWAGYIFELQ